MKKIIILFVFIFCMFIGTNSFATQLEDLTDETSEIVGETQVESNGTEENTDEGTDDSAIYLNNYDEYEELLNSVNQDADNEAMHEQMLEAAKNNYENYVPTQTVKAKVTKAGEIQSYYTESYAKILYQNLEIEILEGEHKGETVSEVFYQISVDSYENHKMPMINKNAIVNVALYEDEMGLAASITNIDSPVKRWTGVLIIIFVSLILIMIYLGTHGLKAVIPIILLIDLAFLFMPALILQGTNIILITTIVLIALAITICTLKLGLKSRTAVAILSMLILLTMNTLIMYGADSLNYLSGVTYEMSTFINTTPINVDVHALNTAITIIMTFFACVPIVCETIKYCEKHLGSKELFKNIVSEMKEYSIDKFITIVPILIVSIFPKYLVLSLSKYTLTELVNSEVMLSEVLKIVYIVIAMVIAAPLTAILFTSVVEEKDKK